MSYLIFILLFCLYVMTFYLCYAFYKLLFYLSNKLIIKFCSLENSKESLELVNVLLLKLIGKSYILLFTVCIIFQLTNEKIFSSILGFACFFVSFLILNSGLSKYTFRSDWFDALKINLISLILLVSIPTLLTFLCYFHYVTTVNVFLESITNIYLMWNEY